jgi:hypothetical protein
LSAFLTTAKKGALSRSGFAWLTSTLILGFFELFGGLLRRRFVIFSFWADGYFNIFHRAEGRFLLTATNNQ